MQRRALLKGLCAAGIPAAAAIATTSATRLRETTDTSIDALKAQVDGLRTRIEKIENKNNKIARAALAIAALSLGVDISALL